MNGRQLMLLMQTTMQGILRGQIPKATRWHCIYNGPARCLLRLFQAFLLWVTISGEVLPLLNDLIYHHRPTPGIVLLNNIALAGHGLTNFKPAWSCSPLTKIQCKRAYSNNIDLSEAGSARDGSQFSITLSVYSSSSQALRQTNCSTHAHRICFNN